jgi:hypothetical protein
VERKCCPEYARSFAFASREPKSLRRDGPREMRAKSTPWPAKNARLVCTTGQLCLFHCTGHPKVSPNAPTEMGLRLCNATSKQPVQRASLCHAPCVLAGARSTGEGSCSANGDLAGVPGDNSSRGAHGTHRALGVVGAIGAGSAAAPCSRPVQAAVLLTINVINPNL